MFGHRLFPGKTNWCIRRYISRRPRKSTMRTKVIHARKNRTGWPKSAGESSRTLLRAGPASRTLTRPRRDPPSLCQQTSDKRKTLIALLSYSRQHASIWWRNDGMEHACTQGNLVRVRAADRRGEGPPAEQGSGHEHAPVHEGRQRQPQGHHLG